MIEIPGRIVRLLMEIGYLAGANGMVDEAEQIFTALQVVRPESEYPLIGSAVTLMNSGRPGEAAKIIWDKALQLNPESDLAKSFLGLALKLSGMQGECRAILEEVIETDRDPQATEMAKSIITELG